MSERWQLMKLRTTWISRNLTMISIIYTRLIIKPNGFFFNNNPDIIVIEADTDNKTVNILKVKCWK